MIKFIYEEDENIDGEQVNVNYVIEDGIDLSYDKLVEHFKRFSLAIGFQQSTIDEFINNE